jgi:hypothetical protein
MMIICTNPVASITNFWPFFNRFAVIIFFFLCSTGSSVAQCNPNCPPVSLSFPNSINTVAAPGTCCKSVQLPGAVIWDSCATIIAARAIIIARDFSNNLLDTFVVAAELDTALNQNPAVRDTLLRFGMTPCLPTGRHEVEYFVEDTCGLVSVVSFFITVEDNVPPVVVNSPFRNISIPASGQQQQVSAASYNLGSNDACAPLLYYRIRRLNPSPCDSTEHLFFKDRIWACCAETGDTLQLAFRVYDRNPGLSVHPNALQGHFSEAIVSLSVRDYFRPTCQAPANVTVSYQMFDTTLMSYGNPVFTDNCCIDSIYAPTINYASFDTECRTGTIVRTFKAADCVDLTRTCTQRIKVSRENPYYVKFPNDTITTNCYITNFGYPVITGGNGCSTFRTSYTDEPIPSLDTSICRTFIRRWVVTGFYDFYSNPTFTEVPNPTVDADPNNPLNFEGPTVSADTAEGLWSPTISPLAPGDTSVNFSMYWSDLSDGYVYNQYISIKDQEPPVVIDCHSGPYISCDTIGNNPLLWRLSSNAPLIDVKDREVDLSIIAYDHCDTDVDIAFELYLDINNDSIQETLIRSEQTGITGLGWNGVPYNNIISPPGVRLSFDSRAVSFNQKYGFSFLESVTTSIKTVAVRWNTQQIQHQYRIPTLPIGNHRIVWKVTDDCGNKTTCERSIVFQECVNPKMYCYPDSTVLTLLVTPDNPTPSVHLSDLNFSVFDDETDPDSLIIGLKKPNSHIGFPFSQGSSTAAQQSLSYTCNDLGHQVVQVWARNAQNKMNYCELKIQVDTQGVSCNVGTEIGRVTDEYGYPVSGVPLNISYNLLTAPSVQVSRSDTTDIEGRYGLGLSVGNFSAFGTKPAYDTLDKEGVTTLDLLLLSQHILDTRPLGSFYKLVAADANRSGTITSFDIVEIRKLILGVYEKFPDNTSWVFVHDRLYGLTHALSYQWKNEIPHQIPYLGLNYNFIAVKIGDLNNSIDLTLLKEGADVRSHQTYPIEASMQAAHVNAGEEVTVYFNVPDKALYAYQMTLETPDLAVVEIIPGAGLTDDHFAVWPDQAAITVAAEHAGEFAVRFRALKSGDVRQLLGITDRITKAIGYANEPGDLVLRWKGQVDPPVPTWVVYQNIPNPWSDATRIGFRLPSPDQVRLEVYDATGRLLYVRSGECAAGEQTWVLEATDLPRDGAMYYRLTSTFGQVTRTMLRAE